MSEDREKSRAITHKIVDLICDMWAADPLHPLSQITNGDASQAQSSRQHLETLLQDSMSNVHNLSVHELSAIIRGTCSVKEHLPTWQMLLTAIYEEFVTRRGVEGATSLLVGLNVPNRVIIERNSGTLHDTRTSQGISY